MGRQAGRYVCDQGAEGQLLGVEVLAGARDKRACRAADRTPPLSDSRLVELKTERLLLRPFRAQDVDDALAYRDDPEFAHFLPHIPQPFTRRDAEAFVATNMTEPWDRSPTFAVMLDERVIGTVNFEIDATTRSAMIGYAIGRAWWGRGIATEAASAAMAWAIATFGLVRVWASTDTRHTRSQRVMEKLGMARETIRTADHSDREGILVDEVVYARTAT